MAGKETFEEAVASYEDRAILAHVPFDLHRQSVHPVRLALATVWSICKNMAHSWYEGAVVLLEYVKGQFPDISTPHYDRIMVDIKLKATLYAYANDPSPTKDNFSQMIDTYFDPVLCNQLPRTDDRVVARKNLKVLVRMKNPAEANSLVKMALMDKELAKTKHKRFLVALHEYVSKVDEALGPVPLHQSKDSVGVSVNRRKRSRQSDEQRSNSMPRTKRSPRRKEPSLPPEIPDTNPDATITSPTQLRPHLLPGVSDVSNTPVVSPRQLRPRPLLAAPRK